MNILSPAHSRIMIVDDDDSVRDTISEILTTKGWKVDAYKTGEHAIRRLREKNYALVLADIKMPGINGMELLEKVREVTPGIPVVMMTGYPSIDLAVEAMRRGAFDFIAKPFKAEKLEVTIKKAIDEANIVNTYRPAVKSRAVRSLPEITRKRLEDKIKELSILHTINETLDEVYGKDDIFKKTMDLAQIITGADRSFIMVLEHNDKDIVVRTVSGYSDKGIVGMKFPVDKEPFRSVIKKKTYSYSVVNDKDLIPLIGSFDPNRNYPLFIIPLLINREVVGIMGLVGDDHREFKSDEISLLQNLTTKASLKLENFALTENIFSSILSTLDSLINALDARDTYTKDHSHRVTRYALVIAKELGCSDEILDSISFAGPLHDIGKIGIRDEILLKKGAFTPDEREIMKSHVIRGEEILKPLNLLESEKAVVLYHHERWDGNGYPNGLCGKEVPLVARIFSVADTFDAMTTTRPYRKALGFDVAKDEITRCSGTQFDPDVVEAFLCCEQIIHDMIRNDNER